MNNIQVRRSFLGTPFLFVFFMFFLLLTREASASTLFEGWFEVFIGAKKIGYMTERFEFVDKKFKATTYIKTSADGGNITESLKAVSADDLRPLSYSFTSKAGNDIKIIDATFKGELMTLKINDGKKERKETKRIKKGTFLSTFLLYLMLQNGGMGVGKNYTYSAIAEEDGTAYIGKAAVTAKEKVKDKEAFKILNNFKNEKYMTWVTPKGEILLTRAPEKNIDVRFAANQAEATKGFAVNNADLKLLFGKIPGDSSDTPVVADEGSEVLGAGAKEAKKKRLTPPPPPELPSKQAGVPGGEGIIIKGVPPPRPTPTPIQGQ